MSMPYKCRECQMNIPGGGNICPYCRSEIKQYGNYQKDVKHPYAPLFIIFMILISLIINM